jgi:hypothetical protein
MSAREPLPGDLERLVDEVMACSRLRGAQRARVAADLREHLEHAVLAGRSPTSIVATFGDPATVAALVDHSPPRVRSSRHVRWLVAACAMLGAGLYGASAARLGTFAPQPEMTLGPLPSRADSLARALRIVRAMKGVHSRSLGARLLEPLYFIRASSVEDVWTATRATADWLGGSSSIATRGSTHPATGSPPPHQPPFGDAHADESRDERPDQRADRS